MNDNILLKLQSILHTRKNASPDESYTARLYAGGIEAITRKINEEAAEVVDAAKCEDNAQLTHEVSDLLFHCLVLLSNKNIPFTDVEDELRRRFGMSGLVEKASRQ